MPRASKPIILTDDQRKELQELVNGADEEKALRARIVLTCAEENENKLVADKLETSPRNVARWKELYREKGIRAITESQSIGSSLSEGRDPLLADKVLAYIAEHPSWKVHELADQFGASVNDIYYVLRKNGITPSQRQRKWAYITTDVIPDSMYYAIGVYLSQEAKAVIIGRLERNLSGKTVQGSVTTSNSKLYRLMESSEEPLSMPGALMEFSSQQAYVSRGKKNRPEALIAETIQEWLHKGADHVYVFACGDPSLKKVASARNEDVTISEAHSADAWLRGLYSWKSAALPEDEWLEADKALAIIDRYVAALPDTGEPFIWKLLPGTAGDPDVQKEGETMYASSMEEIEKKAGNGRKQGSDNEVEVMADLSFRFSDGDVYHKAVRIDDLHLDADELAFATREDFEKGINALDIALDALARKVDIEGRVALLDSVKKNRGQSE